MVNHTDFYMRELWQMFGIPGVLLDRDGKVQRSTIPCGEALVQDLLRYAEGSCIPAYPIHLFEMMPDVYAMLILLNDGTILCFVPVSGSQATPVEKKRWMQKYLPEAAPSFSMASFPVTIIKGLLSILGTALTGKEIGVEEIAGLAFGKDFLTENEDEKERMDCSYQMMQILEDKEHVPYSMEEQFLESVREGKPMPSLQFPPASETLSGIGKLSLSGDKKQMEYMLVSGITLITRTAISAGVPPQRAYHASDLYLQELSVCRSQDEMILVFLRAESGFSSLIQSCRDREEDALVQRAEDYIARCLRKPITIQQMAEDLGFNRSYLSRHFHEVTGLTIQEYIRRQRLQKAANLLRFSEETIGSIAFYMQFGSAGKFAYWFRKEYGMTPSEYRREKKPKEFSQEPGGRKQQTG